MRGFLVHQDGAKACDLLPSEVRFDFVYLDPPYSVGTEMTARLGVGQGRGRKHKASGPVAYVDDADRAQLVETIVRVSRAARQRMSERATLWVHLDHRAVHETKVALESAFGRGAFLGEVIWVPGNGARGKSLSMTHQTILAFARSPADRKKATYNASDPRLREPYAETSRAMHFTNRDEDGRLFRERVIAGKTYRYYADAGRKLGSVWTDIAGMIANTPLNKEGTGYPTQKPVALLERLILLSSLPGDTVADPMCGSGTTLVAAAKQGRSFVGADPSPLAIELSEKRLGALGAHIDKLP